MEKFTFINKVEVTEEAISLEMYQRIALFIDDRSIAGYIKSVEWVEWGDGEMGLDVSVADPSPEGYTEEPIGITGTLFYKQYWSNVYRISGIRVIIGGWFWLENYELGTITGEEAEGREYEMVLTDLGEWTPAPLFAARSFDGEEYCTSHYEEIETALWADGMRSQRHRA